MSLNTNISKILRIGLISWPIGVHRPTSTSDPFINLGEIYDKSVIHDCNYLDQLNKNLSYLYPFKVKLVDRKIKVYNEDDFNYFRKKYKITSIIVLNNYDIKYDKKVFHTPMIFNITCMKPLYMYNISTMYKIPENLQKHYRVFIIFPYQNPVLRGKLLDECILYAKTYTPLFILIGDVYGKNKIATSTLMKRYLVKCGVSTRYIIKTLCDNFPDSIIESLEILPFIFDLNNQNEYDLVIASVSSDIRKVMEFVREKKLSKQTRFQYVCE
jgi:hypothetical protein